MVSGLGAVETGALDRCRRPPSATGALLPGGRLWRDHDAMRRHVDPEY
jgi:hypothetical protein